MSTEPEVRGHLFFAADRIEVLEAALRDRDAVLRELCEVTDMAAAMDAGDHQTVAFVASVVMLVRRARALLGPVPEGPT